MSVSGADRWFVRIRGKVIGPFGLEQLQSLRERGRLLAEHEVSRDRKNWEPAAQLAGVFAPAASAAAPEAGFALEFEPEPAVAAPSAASAGAAAWHYERDNIEHGPVSWGILKQMAASGDLAPEERVWKRGMPDWATASEIPGLFAAEFEGAAPRTRIGRRVEGGRKTARMLGDDLLDALRNAITADDLDAAFRVLVQVGGYALLLAMVAGPGLLIVMAVKTNTLEPAVLSVGALFGIAALRFVAIRLSSACHNLVQASPHRLSSTAFPDAIAVCLLFAGVGALTYFIYSGLRADAAIITVISISLGGQSLAVYSCVACVALHPASLNIDCRSEVRAGEEGIGVLAFLLKLWLRFAPVQFGINAALGALGLTAALILQLAGESQQISAMTLALPAGFLVAASGLIPLLAYLIISLGSVLLDVAQSILAIPKADLAGNERDR